MFCPSCGHDNQTPGKFCASCGAHLLEAGPPQVETVAAAVPPPPIEIPEPEEEPAPPAWAPPAAPVAPAWTPPAAPVVPAPVAAPMAAAPVVVQPIYAAPPMYAPAPVARKSSSAMKSGGLLALVGGAVAAGSAWLPSAVVGEGLMNQDNWLRPWDKWIQMQWSPAITPGAYGDWDPTHPSGHLLVVAGVVVALCGLVLMLGMARAIPARFLLALGAVGGAVFVLAMEYAAYGFVVDAIDSANLLGSPDLITMGFGLYLGVAGAAAAIVGSLVALAGRSD